MSFFPYECSFLARNIFCNFFLICAVQPGEMPKMTSLIGWSKIEAMRPCLFLIWCLITSGCVSKVYHIPKEELVRLSQTPPNQRGQEVRVVQQVAPAHSPAPVVDASDPHIHVGAVLHVPVAPIRTTSQAPAKTKADDNWAWIAAAVVVGLGLAIQVGTRYDGWVEMHPSHPVHLYGPGGQYQWTRLDEMDFELATWAETAIVTEKDGRWRDIKRAPLDRRGWSYTFLLGTSEIPAADQTENQGFLGHIQFGYFPEQVFGLALDIGLGWAEDSQENTIADTRWALEAQLYPIALGRLHLGGFAQVGLGQQLNDGRRTSTFDWYGSGGALAQLDLTTRLAITGRAGVSYIYGEYVNDLSIGLSVY